MTRSANRRSLRVLFVNSGILGHHAVAGLLEDVAARIDSIDPVHINLSEGLTIRDRLVRRLLSVRLSPERGAAGNLDLRRWRQEFNVGFLAARRVAAAERAGPVDVLHFHTQATAYASLRRMRRVRSIVSIDATQEIARLEAGSRLSRLSYWPSILHDHRVFRAASAITVTSEWAARDLRSHYPDCRAKVRVMPYPVPAWGRLDWLEERARSSVHPLRHRVRVLFMGGDFPRKGGPMLLDAWRAGGLADRATLDLVTDWPLDETGLPPGVRLVRNIRPHSPDWVELWRRADLFAMPTRHDAFGLVFQEAAAAGVPVVATGVNAVPEIVVAGETGLLVPPGDLDALVRALDTLVNDPALRRRMGAAAFERIRRLATPDRYATELAALIAGGR